MSYYSFFRKKVYLKTTWVPSDEVLPLLARPLLSDGFQGAPGFSCPMSLPSVGSKLKGIVFTMPLRQAMFYKGHHTSLHSALHTLRSAINFTSDIFSSTINWCAPFEKLSRIRADVIDISSVFQCVSGLHSYFQCNKYHLESNSGIIAVARCFTLAFRNQVQDFRCSNLLAATYLLQVTLMKIGVILLYFFF